MLCSASPENEQSAHVIGHISLARHVRFRQLPSSKSKYETVCILKRTGSQAGGDFHSVEDLVHSPEVAECALASPSQRPKPSGQRCGGIRLRTQMRHPFLSLGRNGVPALWEWLRAGRSLRRVAIKADTLSLTAWQVGMYALMAVAYFRVFGDLLRVKLHTNSAEFWFTMQVAMTCGFLTSYPVNWWLVTRGIKERM